MAATPPRVTSGRSDADRTLPVLTPEGAALDVELAGLGARGAAAAVDLVLAATALLAMSAAGVDARTASRPELVVFGIGWADSAARVVVPWLAASVVAGILAPAVQELCFGGRTLGKRALGVRVVSLSGRRPPASALVLRNALRCLDMLPGTYAVGAISMLVTSRSQRLGDLASGTTVVRLRRPLVGSGQVGLPSTPWQSMGPPTMDGQAIATAGVDTRTWELAGLTAEHRQVLQAFAARRYGLPPPVRADFASWLASVLRRAIDGIPDDMGDEAIIDVLLLRLAVSRPVPVAGRLTR